MPICKAARFLVPHEALTASQPRTHAKSKHAIQANKLAGFTRHECANHIRLSVGFSIKKHTNRLIG